LTKLNNSFLSLFSKKITETSLRDRTILFTFANTLSNE